MEGAAHPPHRLRTTNDGRVFRRAGGGRSALEPQAHASSTRQSRRVRVGVAGVNVAVSIRDRLREAFDAGRTEATKRATTSHWKYWLSFCEAWGIDPDTFGSVRNASSEASTLELAKEL